MDRTPAQLMLLFRAGQRSYKREIVQLAHLIAIGTSTGFTGDAAPLKRLTSRIEAEGDGVAGGFRDKIRGLIRGGKVRTAGGSSGDHDRKAVGRVRHK